MLMQYDPVPFEITGKFLVDFYSMVFPLIRSLYVQRSVNGEHISTFTGAAMEQQVAVST